MAEKIVIEIVADGAGVEPGIKAVEKLGTAAEKDIATFNKLNQTVGNDTSAAVKKVVISAEQARKAFADTSKGGKDGFAQIREEVTKTTQATDNQTKALRTQIQEAKKLQAQLAQTFGENSAQANNAAKNVAKLTELQDDLNKRAQAFNPEAKFQAFTQVTQGLFGSFQALTGAMQLFGVESEQAQKIAQQFQGAINVTQGLNSILGLKDAFGNLRAVLGLTAAAQETLAVATTQTTGAIVAEGAAATGAAAATRGFTAALLSNPFTAVAVVLASIATALYFIAQNGNDAAEAVADFAANSEEADKAFANVLRNSFDADNNKLRSLERQLDIMEAMGASEYEILKQKMAINDQEIMIESNIRNNLKAKQEQLKQDEILYDLTAERAVLEFKINELISRRVSTPEKIDLLFDNPNIEQKTQEAIDLVKKQVKENPVVLFDPADTNATDLSRQYFEQQKEELDAFYDHAAEQVLAFGDVVSGSFEFFAALNQQDAQNRIASLELQKEAGILSEQQYQSKVKKIRREAAIQQKAQALFEAAINASVAIINALKVPFPGTVPAVALASTLSALQIATIAARPIPAFKKGQLPKNPGSFAGQDDQLALVNNKEAIFSAEQTMDYYPAISAMYQRKITPALINGFVNQQTVKHRVKASISSSDIRYGVNGAYINIKNQHQLADSIGDAIATRIGTSRVASKRT